MFLLKYKLYSSILTVLLLLYSGQALGLVFVQEDWFLPQVGPQHDEIVVPSVRYGGTRHKIIILFRRLRALVFDPPDRRVGDADVDAAKLISELMLLQTKIALEVKRSG